MMKYDGSSYVGRLRSLLVPYGNPENAVAMKKYMRDKFEFLGIKSPLRKELFRSFIKSHGWPEVSDLEDVCVDLYSQPEREFHYFALEMIDRNSKNFNESAVKLFEYMIVTNAWWDTVDFIAASILGKYFKAYPEKIKSVTNVWMDSGNIWLQRSCILFQLKYKKSTDTIILYDFIGRLKASDEFFIKKSIGWILREYSKVNPGEVIRYTDATILKPLSRKEALKIIEKKKL